MLHTHSRVGNALIASKGDTELGNAITVRMKGNITPPLFLAGHAFLAHLRANGWKHSLKGIYPRIGDSRRIDHAKQLVEFDAALGDKLFVTEVECVPPVTYLLTRLREVRASSKIARRPTRSVYKRIIVLNLFIFNGVLGIVLQILFFSS